MILELTAELKEAYIETAKVLKRSDRRVFMARIVKSLGKGGQRLAERELGWCRNTSAIADSQSQTDPTFETTRLYTRLTVAEVHRQLMVQKGYTDNELPGEETIRVKLNDPGYQLRAVQKSRPQKDT